MTWSVRCWGVCALRGIIKQNVVYSSMSSSCVWLHGSGRRGVCVYRLRWWRRVRHWNESYVTLIHLYFLLDKFDIQLGGKVYDYRTKGGRLHNKQVGVYSLGEGYGFEFPRFIGEMSFTLNDVYFRGFRLLRLRGWYRTRPTKVITLDSDIFATRSQPPGITTPFLIGPVHRVVEDLNVFTGRCFLGLGNR